VLLHSLLWTRGRNTCKDHVSSITVQLSNWTLRCVWSWRWWSAKDTDTSRRIRLWENTLYDSRHGDYGHRHWTLTDSPWSSHKNYRRLWPVVFADARASMTDIILILRGRTSELRQTYVIIRWPGMNVRHRCMNRTKSSYRITRTEEYTTEGTLFTRNKSVSKINQGSLRKTAFLNEIRSDIFKNPLCRIHCTEIFPHKKSWK